MAEHATNGVTQPGWGLVLGAGIAAFLIAASSFRSERSWWHRVVDGPRVLSTIVHEAGHAATWVATGGEVHTIRIDSVDTGATAGSSGLWLASIVRALAGYAAPPLAGLGIAVLLDDGKSRIALILTIVVMVLVLTVSHGFRTRAYVIAVGFVVFAVIHWGSVGLQQWVAYVEAWLLLLCEIGGLRTFRVVDAKVLARMTLIPGRVWVLGWLALNGWALWTAVPLLWP